jgi:hypothetical protein
MPYDDEELLPDLTPEEYTEIERQWYYGLMLHVAIQLHSRAQAMDDHAKIHRAVSKTIIDCVIGGKKFIAIIWDARTQGTHGEPCEAIVIRRYGEVGTPQPKDLSGKLPTVLTAEELQNANAAAEEFSVWLEQHKPVGLGAAVQAFQEIGSRHRSQDDQFEFVFTLEHARACLRFLRGEIASWP